MKTLFLSLVAVLALAHPASAQIDVQQLQIVNSPDVRGWAPTATITSVQFWKDAGLHFEFDKHATWPDCIPPGWDGPLQYTVWILLRVNGQWYGSGIIEMWRDRQSTDDASVTENNKIARDWVYDGRWGAMAGHQPQPGEMVGFMLTNGDARGKDAHCVAERTKIVELAWPASSPANPSFVWVEGENAPIPTPTPTPTPVPVPSPTPAPLPSTDLAPVLTALNTLINVQAQQLAIEKDTNAQVADLNRSVGQTVKNISVFVSKYIAPAVAAWVLARKGA